MLQMLRVLGFVFSASLAKGQKDFGLALVCCEIKPEQSLAHKALKCCTLMMFSRPLHPTGRNNPCKAWKSFFLPQNNSTSRKASIWQQMLQPCSPQGHFGLEDLLWLKIAGPMSSAGPKTCPQLLPLLILRVED